MKTDYINPFLAATKNVIETMAKTKVTNEKPYLKQGNLSWGVITGVIGMASSNIKGHMVISFDEGSILGIVSNMLGENFPEINRDVVDAVGEITNMICGGAKKDLSATGYMFDLAIPLMVMGKNVEIAQLSQGPIITIPFATDKGRFVVEANLVERTTK